MNKFNLLLLFISVYSNISNPSLAQKESGYPTYTSYFSVESEQARSTNGIKINLSFNNDNNSISTFICKNTAELMNKVQHQKDLYFASIQKIPTPKLEEVMPGIFIQINLSEIVPSALKTTDLFHAKDYQDHCKSITQNISLSDIVRSSQSLEAKIWQTKLTIELYNNELGTCIDSCKFTKDQLSEYRHNLDKLIDTQSYEKQYEFYALSNLIHSLKIELGTHQKCLEHNNKLIDAHIARSVETYAKFITQFTTLDLKHQELPRLAFELQNLEKIYAQEIKTLESATSNAKATDCLADMHLSICVKEIELKILREHQLYARTSLEQKTSALNVEIDSLKVTLIDSKVTLIDQPLMDALDKAHKTEVLPTSAFQTLTADAKELVTDCGFTPEKFNVAVANSTLHEYIHNKNTAYLNEAAKIYADNKTNHEIVEHSRAIVKFCHASQEALSKDKVSESVSYTKVAQIITDITIGLASGVARGYINNGTQRVLQLIPGYKVVSFARLVVATGSLAMNANDWNIVSAAFNKLSQCTLEQKCEFIAQFATEIISRPNPIEFCKNFIQNRPTLQNLVNKVADSAQKVAKVVGAASKEIAIATQFLYKIHAAHLVTHRGITFDRNQLPNFEKFGSAKVLMDQLDKAGVGYLIGPKQITYNSEKIDLTFPNRCLGRDITGEIINEKWDMPVDGGIINGRYYSRHALERMAPNTQQVRDELIVRAIAKGYRPGTKSFNDYIQPRNIPPSVIEDVIQNCTPISGKYPFTWDYINDNVKIVVNEFGDVVTVHRL